MKMETTLSTVGRSIDTAITAVHTQTPILIKAGRTRVAGILVRASELVGPKVNEPETTAISTQGVDLQDVQPGVAGSSISTVQEAPTMEEATH